MNLESVLSDDKCACLFISSKNKDNDNLQDYIKDIKHHKLYMENYDIEDIQNSLDDIFDNSSKKYSLVIFHNMIQHESLDEELIKKVLKKFDIDATILIKKDLSSSALLMLKSVEMGFKRIMTYGYFPKSDYRIICFIAKPSAYKVIVKDINHKKFTFEVSNKDDFLLALALTISSRLIHSNPPPQIELNDAENNAKRKFKIKNKSFDILFVGDTSFGENYQFKIKRNGGINILEKNGYHYSLKNMRPLMMQSDFVVCNLETPITNIKESPYFKMKDYIHWTDVDKAPMTLINHNVGLISLANNHVFDFAIDGFNQTISVLEKNSLPFIGAGKDILEAVEPFIIEIEYDKRNYRIAIIAAFEELKNYAEKYDVYSSIEKPGLMPLDIELISKKIKKLKKQDSSIFVVIFPHWGGNYKLRDKYQLAAAHSMNNSGADLIIGHGSHMIQEFEKMNDKWVFFSIGNFVFNSRGRYQKLDVPPYSAVVKLIITPDAANQSLILNLKLYPIITDNLITNYQPRFLTESEFDDFYRLFYSKEINKEKEICELSFHKDKFGYHFNFPIERKNREKSISDTKYIGFICRIVRIKDLRDHIFLWMHRAMVIEGELVNYGYTLLCYTLPDINVDNQTVSGYVYKNGQFKNITTIIPKINYGWHIGSVKHENKKGLRYREYEKWAIEHGRMVFPSYSFRLFTQDKLETYHAIMKLDKNLMPYTEILQDEDNQLQRFLDMTNRVFIKPRRGRMGNDIMVVTQDGSKFHIKYYLDKEVSVNVFNNLSQTVKFLKEKSSRSSYIIQEAIHCIRFSDSVFDIRVMALNNGTSWNLITEIRVGAKNSDLSNVSQGGINHESQEILLQFLSQEKTNKLINKINLESKRIADYLSKKFNEGVNEFAIDFMVDNKLNIFLAELNVKPGLSGMPELFNDFYNMSEQEKLVYNKYTIPHGRILAQFLMNWAEKSCQDENQTDAQDTVQQENNYWFDHVLEPLDIQSEDYKKLTSAFFNALISRNISYNFIKTVFLSDQKPRILFLTLKFNEKSVYIYKSTASGLVVAFESLLKEALQAHENTSQLIAIKLDLVQSVTVVNNFKMKEKLILDRGLEGLAFKASSDIAFLPEQIISNNIVNKSGILKFRKIENNFNFSASCLDMIRKDYVLKIYKFRTLSAFSSHQENFLLFRGHRYFNRIKNKNLLIQSICQSTSYLHDCVKRNGRFIYEYLPKKDKATNRYNILRHAGTIYAMLEAFELLKQKSLLEKIKLAIEQLINHVKPMKLNGKQTACVVEKGFVKLGANALTILVISKYCSIMNDKTYLFIAQQCAMWIEQTQEQSGEFSIHKQNYQNQQVEDFVSEYYPGEAIFALAKLYQIDHNDNWLKVVIKAIDFIIDIRDKAIKIHQLAHDHWLLYGLNECQLLQPNEKLVKHTWKICQAIIHAQSKSTSPPDQYGSFYQDLRSTPTAIRAEGLCAAYHCLINNGMSAEAAKVLQAIQDCICFQLQLQFQMPLAMYLTNPEKIIGGFHKGLDDYSIRIDYVQHNISSLIGLCRIFPH